MPKLKDKLAEARERVSQLRDQRATAVTEKEAAKAAFEATEHLDTEGAEFKAAHEAVRKVGEIDDQLVAAQAAENAILELMGESPGDGSRGHDGPSDLAGQRAQSPWRGAQLLEADGLRERFERHATSTSKFGQVELGEAIDREAFAASVRNGTFLAAASSDLGTADVGGNAIVPDNRGLIERPQRPLRILDLIPTTSTSSNLIEGVKEVPTAVAAAEVAEGNPAPAQPFEFVDDEWPVRTIRAYVKAKRIVLEDWPRLRSYLNVRLPYKVMARLNSQVLAGDGNAPNLRGIANTTGIGTYQREAGESVVDALHKAITVAFLFDYVTTFAAMHPTVWQDIRLSRENGDGSGAYLFGSPAMAVRPTVWGQDVLQDPLIAAANPIVGDPTGAECAIRSGVTVYVSDSDGDDFLDGRIAMLAEVRAAVPVEQPAGFVKVLPPA